MNWLVLIYLAVGISYAIANLESEDCDSVELIAWRLFTNTVGWSLMLLVDIFEKFKRWKP